MRTSESTVHPGIAGNPLVQIQPIPSTPAFLKTNHKALFLLFGPLKVVFQVWALLVVLGYRTKPAKWIIIQVSKAVRSIMAGRKGGAAHFEEYLLMSTKELAV